MVLWDICQERAHLTDVHFDAATLKIRLSRVQRCVTRQHAERCCFTSAVVTQQSEALAALYS